MERCVGVSTETVLQIVKFYTVVKKNFLIDVSDCSPSSFYQLQTMERSIKKFVTKLNKEFYTKYYPKATKLLLIRNYCMVWF